MPIGGLAAWFTMLIPVRPGIHAGDTHLGPASNLACASHRSAPRHDSGPHREGDPSWAIASPRSIGLTSEGSTRLGETDPDTAAVVADRRIVTAATGGATVPWIVVPGPATHHTGCPGLRTSRIFVVRFLVILVVVPILAPLPGGTRHRWPYRSKRIWRVGTLSGGYRQPFQGDVKRLCANSLRKTTSIYRSSTSRSPWCQNRDGWPSRLES